MKKFKLLNFISIAAFTLFSCSVLLTPFSDSYDVTNGYKAVNYVIVAAFWGGLIIGFVSVIAASSQRKKHKLEVGGKLPGIITFFKNKESIAAFCLFAVGLILLLVFRFVNVEIKAVLQIIGMFAALWGFSLHCIFDGLNYRALKNIKVGKNAEEEE